MKKLKSIFISLLIVSLFVLCYKIMWYTNEHLYLEKIHYNLLTTKTHRETLCLLKFTSSIDSYQRLRTRCDIITVMQDKTHGSKKSFTLSYDNKTIAYLQNLKKLSELQLLAEWISKKATFMNSTKYFVYLDLINFTKNIKEGIHYLYKPGCLKCVCFLLNNKQKLLGFSGPKNKAIQLIKQKKIITNLKNGLKHTNSISTMSVLLGGIVKFQYCGYDCKEHLCNGEIEQCKNNNISTQNTQMQKEMGQILKDEICHIVYATSMGQIEPMVISIKSILQSTSMKSRLHFHILYYTNNLESHLEELGQLVTGCGALITFHRYNGLDEVEPLINKEFISRPELFSPNNYIRLLLHEKLSRVKWCLWLDNDVFVLKDVVPLFAKVYAEGDKKTIASFPVNKGTRMNRSVLNTLKSNGVKVSISKYPRVQAGILFMNLEKWKKDKVYAQILKISKLNRQFKLYNNLGSQAPIDLLFNGNNFYHLNPNLEKQNLGYGSSSYNYIPCDAIFLHWNGAKKPWISEWMNEPQNQLLWNHVLNQTKDLKCLDMPRSNIIEQRTKEFHNEKGNSLSATDFLPKLNMELG